MNKMVRMEIFFIAIAFSLFLAPLHAEKIYQLTEIQKNSDFDEDFIKNIDSHAVPYPKDGNFMMGTLKTKKGIYTIYRFVHAYISSYHEEPQNKVIFHDFVMIKADARGKILDAYQYTMEWQDSPSARLLRLGNPWVFLKQGLKLNDLKFRYAGQTDFVPVPGILDTVFGYKKIIKK